MINREIDSLNLYSKVKSTKTLGPGDRYVIWFQGCKKNCKNCIAVDSHQIDNGEKISIDSIISEILLDKKLTGVTISGGEPFLQFDALYMLIKKIKDISKLDIMVYSGYKYEEILKEFGKDAEDLFSSIDIFIDGEYIDDLNDNQLWRGSSNQNIYCFTEKYKNYKDKIENSIGRSFEFIIDDDNFMYVGIPDKSLKL